MADTTMTVQTDSGQSLQIPSVLPVVPLKEIVAFPYMMFPLVVAERELLDLVDETLAETKMIGLFPVRPGGKKNADAGKGRPGAGQADATDSAPSAVEAEAGGEKLSLPEPAGTEAARAETVGSHEELSRVGTAAIIHKMLRFPDGGMRLLVQGVTRVSLTKVVQEKPYLKAQVDVIRPAKAASRRVEALRRNALELFQKLVDATGYLSEELKVVALNIEDAGRLADFLGANLNLRLEEKLALLEERTAEKRLERVTAFMVRELDILALGRRIQDQVQNEMEKSQREFYLRQQMKAIQKELGAGNEDPELIDLGERIEKADMPREALEAAKKEFERLRVMPPQAAEYSVARTYIDWMLQFPWKAPERPPIDIRKAERVLNEDHYDLAPVKERILEYLAVRKLTKQPRSPILCFAGPPGVGKTSLGQSIARALERPFVRLSLGGLHDEAEIRGHRRTYIGAMPGRIVQGMVQVKAADPVFMLDEVDKVGMDFRGDPTSALLEVLDPEQNDNFHDNYLNVSVDLSRVLFITTANALYSIVAPLRDRMEIIELPGYTTAEKAEIARRYLVPRSLEMNGITSRQLRFTKPALTVIANEYTHESGVRELERQINRVARKVATRVARGRKTDISITKQNLAGYLGKPKIWRERRERKNRPGVVTALAWTPYGGEILFVEATRMAGRGGLILTGQLGDVMKESASAALSYVRSHVEELTGETVEFEKSDFHIHVPSGAMPKDGPSAGVAMVTALASLLSGRPVRSDTAMTGEISLRGMVLPIGGVKQKVLGARRAGIRRVILPAHNKVDLDEVPGEIQRDMKFVFVRTIEEVLEAALPAKRKTRTKKRGKVRAKSTSTRKRTAGARTRRASLSGKGKRTTARGRRQG